MHEQLTTDRRYFIMTLRLTPCTAIQLAIAWGEKTAHHGRFFHFKRKEKSLKTIVYIDGYNLFYGCLKHSKDKWLDLKKVFFDAIVYAQNPRAELTVIKFFTADIKAKVASQGQYAQQSQQNYHRALTLLYPEHIQIIKGYYSLEKAKLLAYKKPPDKTERVDVWRLEEKQTDVNIALEAYRDVVKGRVEQLVFVSNDTDLAPALSAIRADFGAAVQIGVVIPVRECSNHRPGNKQLSQHANWTRKYITDKELTDSHLPLQIPTNRKPIKKPTHW